MRKLKAALERNAWAIAVASLVVALGSGAYAATQAPKNSVTSASIQNSSIKGKDVRDDKLTGADFDESTFDKSQLPQGPPGQPGTSLFNAPSIPSGQTVTGYIGDDSHASSATDDADAAAAFPLPAPVALTDGTVDLNGVDEVGNRCTGSAANPTAPSGVVCIYDANSSPNFESAGGFALPNASARGIIVDLDAVAAGDFFFHGIWAYTAP